MMIINVQKLHRLAVASIFAAGLVSVGAAAGAQVIAPVTATAAATNASNVALSTTTKHVDRAAEIESENADARRIAFRHLGTSL